jgi:transglutaminase-like putative cysteine protease
MSDPENVTYMEVEVTQSGHLRMNSKSPSSLGEELRLSLYVPQNDSRQTSRITKVIGPNSYRMEKDEYGNAQIILEWEDPPLDWDIDYLVESRVEVESKSSGESRDFPMTDLVRPTADIIETAYTVAGGESSVENMLSLGAYVNDFVTYDTSCEDVTLGAGWVYENERGTCDEFSNLYLSMLKVLGYKSWYVAGYAYLGGKQEGAISFGAHAWVETRFRGKTYDIDPTWAESPVDATHLTFARMPDSNFTELMEAKSRDTAIEWKKEETVIRLLDYRDNPRVSMELGVVPETVQDGKNVLVTADMLADGCVLSSTGLASCISIKDKKPLLDIKEPRKSVVFCGNKTEHWIATAPDVDVGMIYQCPLMAASGGARAGSMVSIEYGTEPEIELGVSTQKILVPGQSLEVWVTSKNTGFVNKQLRVFTILGDQIQEKGINLAGGVSGHLKFDLTAPMREGEHVLTAFSSSGDVTTETITVIGARQIKITEISMPGEVEVGDSKVINVTLRNFGESITGTLKLQIGEHEDSRTVEMGMNGSKIVDFYYAPDTAGEHAVSIALLDSEGIYQDAWVGRIEATTPLSLKAGIAKWLEQFFSWLFGSIRSLFGL